MRRLPVLRLLSLVGAGSLSASTQDSRQSYVVRVSSDAESYFSVRVPKSAPDLRIYAQSTNGPVQLAVAVGYFPKESHFDACNFAAWAKGRHSSEVHVPLARLRSPPRCDGPEGRLEACLGNASRGEGLRCGGEPRAAGAVARGGAAQSCPKRVGQCSRGVCDSRLRGPTLCNATGARSARGGHRRRRGQRGSRGAPAGDCLCQRGFCAGAGGLCVEADAVQAGCAKVTGQTCPLYACNAERGAANCEDGVCVCAAGHCSVRGVCQPGPLCEELNHQAICEVTLLNKGPNAPAVAKEDASDLHRKSSAVAPAEGLEDLPAAAEDECCQLMNAARKRDPGRFARCVAGHFFSVERARARGTRAPLLADLRPPDISAGFDDVVVMARGRAGFGGAGRGSDGQAITADQLQASSDEVHFWFDVDGRKIGKPWPSEVPSGKDSKLAPIPTLTPLPMQSLQLFRTLEELVSPSRSATGSRKAALEQQEVPLLRLVIPALNSASIPLLPAPPSGASTLRLWQDELLLLRLSEAHQDAALAEGLRGELRLHLRGLPVGSSVLYSRAWPAPRSLLDLGHAVPVADRVVAGLAGQEPGVTKRETVWQARGRSAQYFAVLPSADGYASAYFTVQPLQSAGALAAEASRQFPAAPPPPLPAEGPPVASPNEDRQDALEADTHWFAVAWFGITLGISSLAICRWVLRRDAPEEGSEPGGPFDTRRILETLAETPRRLLGASGQYMPVVGSDEEAARAAPCAPPGADSDDEAGQVCPKAPSFSSLKVFGLAMAKRLSAVGRGGSPRSPAVGAGRAVATEEQRRLLSCDSRDDEDSGRASPPRGQLGSSTPVFRGREAPPSPIDSLRGDDRQAMAALMKLRPAARDSVGDDTLEDIDGPLMGTARSQMLSR